MPQGHAFDATEEQRKTVRVMSAFGIRQAEITILLDINPKTLRLHFRRELDRGSVEATAKVAQTLFQMATSGQSTAASIFWMKERAGWREKHEVQVSAVRPLVEMTDAELVRIIQEAGGDPNEVTGGRLSQER
jgi:hypothetical protein